MNLFNDAKVFHVKVWLNMQMCFDYLRNASTNYDALLQVETQVLENNYLCSVSKGALKLKLFRFDLNRNVMFCSNGKDKLA